METSEKLQSIMEKGKYLFICDQQEKINKAMHSLMKYCLYKNKKERDELKLFFHSLKGTGATFNFENISNIGRKYEDYICSIESEDKLPNEVFYTLLKGVSQVNEEIEKLNKEYSTKEKNNTLVEEKAKSNISSGNILIVDDDITLLNQLERVFEYEGYNVISTSKSYEVEQIIQDETIDIILLDIMMPKLDGFEVFNKLKKEKLDIPILFLTAKTFLEDKLTALNSGADDYITKPFKVEEVVARVNRALERSTQYRKDELTGAYTKKYFKKRIKEVQKRWVQSREICSLAFIDLDHFKKINDEYGHIVGDSVLKQFTNTIKNNIRSNDELFRFGGDEFIIIFPDITDIQANSILERIKDEVQSNMLYCSEIGKAINLSFSCGISTTKDENESIDEFIETADRYLYISKQCGRNRNTYAGNIQ